MNSDIEYLHFEPFYINECKSDGYGIFDIYKQKGGFHIENIDTENDLPLSETGEKSQTIMFKYKDKIIPFILICETKSFSHIFIKKYIKTKTNEPFKKLLNKSIHIITSDPKIICDYKIKASCKNNIEIKTYNLNDNIPTITCEYFSGHSELDPVPPNSIFKNIDKKYIENKHSYFKTKNQRKINSLFYL
jgi:hypothetical protein